MRFPSFSRLQAVKAITVTSSATWLGMGAPGIPIVEGDSGDYSLGSLVPGFPDLESTTRRDGGRQESPVPSKGYGEYGPVPNGVPRTLEAWECDL